MAELLLEIFCEEIPARMQAKAESDLKKAVLEGLSAGGLTGTQAASGADESVIKVASMSGPRRLAVVVEGLAARSADVSEERKGPKVGAPEQAVQGFLRGAGLSSIDEAEIQSDPKKGDFYVARRTIPGRATPDIVAELVPQIVRNFHWPKSMRTGTGELRWVRPLQRILCLFDGKVVPFEIDGIASGDLTEGHRVHGRGPFQVSGLESYVTQLGGEGHVMLTRDDRRDKIEADAKAVCEKAGLELVEDAGLLEEVVGLAEWPCVVLGDMDPAFLDLPPEVIQLSMRTHQKYFAVRDPKTGTLAPHFVVVANIDADDGGKAIAAGNRKVLSARLDDGRFFWDNDKKTGLEAMAPKLASIKFKDELGSIGDKVERVAALAEELAQKVGAGPKLARKAAELCKADLVSEMVYEFPELQGVMGRYYALEALNADGSGPDPESPADKAGADGKRPRIKSGAVGTWSNGLSEADIRKVADAIADHYKPQGPSDAVPADPVSIAVALADKLDTLVGFWAIDEKPTGSKDPFALRRAALGVVRIVLENGVRLGLLGEFAISIAKLANVNLAKNVPSASSEWSPRPHTYGFFDIFEMAGGVASDGDAAWHKADDLLSFFADRLKQYLRDQGQRHDLIDAVFALGEDDLVLITKRVEALGAFLATEDGANLLAGYKRAANILKAEEKKDKRAFDGAVEAKRLDAPAEKALFAALGDSTKAAEQALANEDFAAAMSALASLRGPVDAFFEGEGSVMVNADDPKLRENRLNLLNQMREAIHTVADFSLIEG